MSNTRYHRSFNSIWILQPLYIHLHATTDSTNMTPNVWSVGHSNINGYNIHFTMLIVRGVFTGACWFSALSWLSDRREREKTSTVKKNANLCELFQRVVQLKTISPQFKYKNNNISFANCTNCNLFIFLNWAGIFANRCAFSGLLNYFISQQARDKMHYALVSLIGSVHDGKRVT